MKAPQIKAYSRESVIAEKFEAMIDLEYKNSRMKDFYDIFNLLNAKEYDETNLKEAILNTFIQRQTPYNENTAIFSDDFASKKEIQWDSFLRKNKLQSISLKEVLSLIKTQLQPIYEEIRPNNFN